MLKHNTSTLGGAGGAPLIDVATGQVLGIHYGGQYLLGNYTARAWEARRDPQWAGIWSGEMKPAAPVAARKPSSAGARFSKWRISARSTTGSRKRASPTKRARRRCSSACHSGIGRLPGAGNIADRLFLALGYLNDSSLKFGEKPPLLYVLMNARRHRRFEPEALAEMDRYLEKLKALP